jgi:tRNA threonylcarbamoyladenosine biosynthesis protein TsaB
MNILVTDTSSQALTVAIYTDAFSEVRRSQGRSVQHSERLVPTVVELCKDAGLDTKDVDLLLCTRGPGSFTGLRIGMAAFKGMAFALDKPIVSVSTLEAYASCVEDFEGAIVSVLDAKKQRWYLAAFESSLAEDGSLKLKRLVPDTDGTEADLVSALAKYDKILVVGPDAKAFAEVLKNLYSTSSELGYKQIFTSTMANEAIANAILKLGLKQYEAKGADDIGQGPVYLRKSDAELALEEKLAKEANNG